MVDEMEDLLQTKAGPQPKDEELVLGLREVKKAVRETLTRD